MNNVTIELGSINNSCFVVMPFKPLFQVEYDKIIKPALTELNIECIRGDEIYSKQRIVDDIWESIKKCRFVLAELTGKNPNVLYEIGLAHAIGKPVIILTRNAEDVPFDLQSLRYLFYDVDDPFWGDNLKIGIQNLAKKIIENPNIDKYLEGITIVQISLPEISSKSEAMIKTNIPTIDVSGMWVGNFTNRLSITHMVTLQLNQFADDLSGMAIISYPILGVQTVVQEVVIGNIMSDGSIDLRGANFTFIQRGNDHTYSLDSFVLKFDNKKKILKGHVSSNLYDPEWSEAIEFRKLNVS